MRTTSAVAFATLGIAIGLTGCGGGSDASPAASSSGSPQASSAPIVAEAKAAVATYLEGTDRALPKTGPKGIKGKSIFAIPCLAAAPGCQLPLDAFRDAAKALDWKVTMVDSKGTPEGGSAAVDAAIAAKADGILLESISCLDVQAALKRAHDAGIKVYAIGGLDCDDPAVHAGGPLFDGQFSYGKYGKTSDWIKVVWREIADYVIATTDGKARVIAPESLTPEISVKEGNAFRSAMARCTTCKVYKLPFTLDDLSGNKLELKVGAALSAHPDANVVVGPYDAAVLLGIGNAVQTARNNGRKILLTGNEGLPAALDLVRKGILDMSAGSQPLRWTGWAAVDGMNRVFAGQPQVDAGFGVQLITKTQNLPSTPYYDGNPRSSGYDENYKRIWGVQ
jgi:ribose transport system substrate-binding protein